MSNLASSESDRSGTDDLGSQSMLLCLQEMTQNNDGRDSRTGGRVSAGSMSIGPICILHDEDV
jgi:hypothetical protein